jgi:hypothetical protein
MHNTTNFYLQITLLFRCNILYYIFLNIIKSNIKPKTKTSLKINFKEKEKRIRKTSNEECMQPYNWEL